MSSTPIPPKPSPLKELIKPTEKTKSPSEAGWKRTVSHEEGTAIPRAKLAEGAEKPEKLGKEFEQAEPGVFSEQLLLDDVLSIMMREQADIPTAAAFQEVSKKLKELSQNIDFKTLADLRKSSQWTIKYEIAMRILLTVALTASAPAIEDFKKISALDMNLSPKEASELISQIKHNYPLIQNVWNDLLQSTSALLPMAYTMGTQTFLSILPLPSLLLYCAFHEPSATSLLYSFAGDMALQMNLTGSSVMEAFVKGGIHLIPLSLLAAGYTPTPVHFLAATLGAASVASVATPGFFAPITLLRTTTTGILTTLINNVVGLPESTEGESTEG